MSELSNQQTVLVVDADPIVRRYVTQVLGEEGFTVLQATDQNEAVQVATNSPQAIYLMIDDLHLPSCRATELARVLAAQFPRMQTLIISSLYRRIVRCQDTPKARWLTKPFSPEALQRRVKRLLAQAVAAVPQAGMYPRCLPT